MKLWWPGSQTWQTNGQMDSWLHHSGGGEGPHREGATHNTLPENIRVYVKERKPATSQEAGELADDHIRARKDEESNILRLLCQHDAANAKS